MIGWSPQCIAFHVGYVLDGILDGMLGYITEAVQIIYQSQPYFHCCHWQG